MSSPAPPPSTALPGSPPASCPPSATLPWSALFGFAGFCAMIATTADMGLPKHVFTCLCVLATALPMLIIDLGVLKVHRRPSTGLAWGDEARPGFSASRVATKLAGLGVTFGALAFVYWYAPEWSTGKHGTFFLALRWALPVLVPAGLLYLAFVDAHMKDPEDVAVMKEELDGLIDLAEEGAKGGVVFRGHDEGFHSEAPGADNLGAVHFAGAA